MINHPAQRTPRKLDRLQLVALAGLMFIGTAFVLQRHDGQRQRLASLPWYRPDAGCDNSSGMRSASARARRCACVDYHTLARWSFVVYWATIFFLVVVLIPHVGSMRFGARRWIDLGPFQFQP